MKAADAVAKFLIHHRVHICFELVGGMITHLIDSFSQSGQIKIISMHHEQAAAFAAEGVARASRGKRLAVAMATSGPGATNLITGIGSCWLDSVPCLFITGQVNTSELKGSQGVRQQGFQELDIVEIVRSITKYAVRVDSVSELLPALHCAMGLAVSGRKGPVLLDIPNDVQRMDVPDAMVKEWLEQPLVEEGRVVAMSDPDLAALRNLCHDARRPLLCIGGGARWSDTMTAWLKAAERQGIPYVSTLMGHERVEAGPLYFNMIGTYGNREANWAVQNCDLLLVLGARLDVRQTGADTEDFARNARIVQVDIDPAQLGNRIKADLSICLDMDNFFRQFEIDDGTFPSQNADWIGQLSDRRTRFAMDEYGDWRISPFNLFALLHRTLGSRPIDYVCDVGNHQMWAAQNLRLCSDQAVYYSGGMGAMGFALPTAIGVALHSSRKAIVITGDGGLQINSQEFDTLNRLGLDVTVLVMNNHSLGMVKNFQEMYFDGRDQSTKKGYSCPTFTHVAAAYSIDACQARNMTELEAAFLRMLQSSHPFLIEVLMDDATECRPRLTYGSKLDEQYPAID